MGILRILNELIDDLESYLEERGLVDDFAKYRRTAHLRREENEYARKG